MAKEPKTNTQQPNVQECEDSFFLQFPSVEKVLKNPPEAFNKRFESLHESLDKLSRTASGMNKKKEARKAMKAVERTMDLFRDLFRMKVEFDQKEGSGASKPQRGR